MRVDHNRRKTIFWTARDGTKYAYTSVGNRPRSWVLSGYVEGLSNEHVLELAEDIKAGRVNINPPDVKYPPDTEPRYLPNIKHKNVPR